MGVLIGTTPYRFISVDDAVSGGLLIAALSAQASFLSKGTLPRPSQAVVTTRFFRGY
jgi:hypothetical protein